MTKMKPVLSKDQRDFFLNKAARSSDCEFNSNTSENIKTQVTAGRLQPWTFVHKRKKHGTVTSKCYLPVGGYPGACGGTGCAKPTGGGGTDAGCGVGCWGFTG